MFNAAASRRAGYTLIRNPRTTTFFSRSITVSTQPRPIPNLTRGTYKTSHLQTQLRSSPFISLRHGPATLQIRPLSYIRRMKLGLREASKGIWRKYPIVLPLAILSVVGATAMFAYIVYIEITQNAPQYHKFPPPVAESLRRGVYYTDVDLNPPKALKAYKEALHIAIEMGMHPFSDEVLGIKLQVAMMLEKAGLVNPAIEVLERTKKESLVWVEKGRKQAAERRKEEAKNTSKNVSPAGDLPADKLEISDSEILDTFQKMKEMEDYEERQRDKAMKKVVGIEMKLAELYASDYIQEPEKAEAAQVAAVELSLKELALREKLGLPIGGGNKSNNAWLTRTEIATALVDLADTYLNKDKDDLALPLYLRALDILRIEEGNKPSCRQVELLNGLAAAMGARAQKPMRGEDPEAMRKQAFEVAGQWALKTLEVAAKISKTATATEEDKDDALICDTSCVAAMYNLGEFAEAQNKLKEAEKWYRDAKAKAMQLEDDFGTQSIDEALERVTKKQVNS